MLPGRNDEGARQKKNEHRPPFLFPDLRETRFFFREDEGQISSNGQTVNIQTFQTF